MLFTKIPATFEYFVKMRFHNSFSESREALKYSIWLGITELVNSCVPQTDIKPKLASQFSRYQAALKPWKL